MVLRKAIAGFVAGKGIAFVVPSGVNLGDPVARSRDRLIDLVFRRRQDATGNGDGNESGNREEKPEMHVN